MSFFLSLLNSLKFLRGSTNPITLIFLKSNSDLRPNSDNFGPPIPKSSMSVSFSLFKDLISSEPRRSPECSPTTMPTLRVFFVCTYLKMPLVED